MSLLSPFRALRPTKDKVHLVTTKSPKLYEKDALRFRLRSNPFSFFNVLRPAKGRTQGRLPFRQRLTSVKMRYDEFCTQGHLLQEETPALYVYKQSSEMGLFTGLIGLTDLKHVDEGRIKVHEETITPRVQLFQAFLESCRFHAEPILITHSDHPALRDARNQTVEKTPEYDFTSTDGVRHTLWVIDNPDVIPTITAGMESLSAVYVADGHHRLASALQAQQTTGEEKCLAMFVPEHQLSINTFKWILKDVNRMSKAQLLQALEEWYMITPLQQFKRPLKQGTVVVCIGNEYYQLEVKISHSKVMDKIDQHLLRKEFIRPIIGIQDIRNDPRIRFEPDLDKDGSCSGQMTFFFAPLEISSIRQVADEGLKLPPKTTYVLPKLRTGLTIYPFAT